MSDPVEITIIANGEARRVARSAYVSAKTKDLREFGYRNLSHSDVSAQLDLILAGTATSGLSVIGKFMIDDIKVPK
jgi:hypothetical protein